MEHENDVSECRIPAYLLPPSFIIDSRGTKEQEIYSGIFDADQAIYNRWNADLLLRRKRMGVLAQMPLIALLFQVQIIFSNLLVSFGSVEVIQV